ncbi:MAG: hypothetical protein HUJ68_00925 [Clostridia bacterium]|nr:hypothetical protein [Clostridia bacterium]
MKIQELAVIAMLIIVPMAILLNVYSSYQMETLSLQLKYDEKLINASYDAVKAFQLNMENSDSSDLSDTKIRNIEAAVGTFYNSLASHFGMAGYGEDVLKDYVPAIVFALYDGYYIYSAYENTIPTEENNSVLNIGERFIDNPLYTNGEKLYGLRPYVYYSCRYKKNSDDFVITYSLDSYITIQGKINGNNVNESGYYLPGISYNEDKDKDKVTYNGIEILQEENTVQKVYIPGVTGTTNDIVIDGISQGSIQKLNYNKINGTKYYQSSSEEGSAFAILNGKKTDDYNIKSENIPSNKNGKNFYIDAYNFTKKWENYLKELDAENAVDEAGNPFKYYTPIENIFDSDVTDNNSNFNVHRIEVIKHAIETNLGTAISQYDKISSSNARFEMPKLSDTDWENITKGVSMITFLQGLSIGGKIYNGYSIIPNTFTSDYISADSIYIIASDNEYHKVTEEGLEDKIDENSIGYLNIDFEMKTAYVGKNIYYYPLDNIGSYSSIISSNGSVLNENQTIDQYFNEHKDDDKINNLAQIYYTALGRERYGIYRINIDPGTQFKNSGLKE